MISLPLQNRILIALSLVLFSHSVLSAEETDFLGRVEPGIRTKDNRRHIDSDAGRILEIDEGAQATLVFEHDSDLPPAGSVIQFFAKIRGESKTAKEIAMRYGCRLKPLTKWRCPARRSRNSHSRIAICSQVRRSY